MKSSAIAPAPVSAAQTIGGIEVLSTLGELTDPAHSAVLVIDMQNENILADGHYYADNPGWMRTSPIPNPPRLAKHFEETHDIPQYQRFLAAARAAGVTVIYVEFLHLGYDQSALKLMYGPAMMPPERPERWWSMTCKELAPEEGEMVIYKHDGDTFKDTGLDRLLRARGIKSLILTGTATNGCVLASAWGAEMHGYYPVLVRDLVNQGTPAQRREAASHQTMPKPDLSPGAHYERCLAFMETRYAVLPSQAVMAAWRSPRKAAAKAVRITTGTGPRTKRPTSPTLRQVRLDLKQVDPARTVVLVAAMQNEFLSMQGGYARQRPGRSHPIQHALLPRFKNRVNNLRALIAGARRAGALIIYTQYITMDNSGKALIDGPVLQRFVGKPWRPRLAEGNWAADIITELDPQPGDLVIRSHHENAFLNTALLQILRSRSSLPDLKGKRPVERILVTGLDLGTGLDHALLTGYGAMMSGLPFNPVLDCLCRDRQYPQDIWTDHGWPPYRSADILAAWKRL